MDVLEDAKLKLGEEGYAKLLALIASIKEREYAAGFEANGWGALFRGALHSWTAWFSAFLIGWPALQGQLQPLIERLIGTDNWSLVVSIIGAIVLLLRIKTDQSLEDKGAVK